MLWAVLDFLFDRLDFFPPCALPYKVKNKYFFYKNHFTVIVLKMRGQGQKNNYMGGAKRPPPIACLGILNFKFLVKHEIHLS